MKELLETERLIIRTLDGELDSSIIDGIYDICSDPETMEFFPSPLSYEQCLELVDKIQDHYREYDYSLNGVFLKETDEFIGLVGLLNVGDYFKFYPAIEIGWRIHKKYWNQGYATEAARATLDYGFNILDLKRIYAFTAQINKRSQRVMEKLGMEKILDFNHPKVEGDLRPHLLYRINKNS